MSVRLITLTIVAFLFGALAAGGVGVRVIREVRTSEDATSLPAQNIARADGYHVDPGETLISSVALVPDGLVFGDDGLEISYDLTSLAPSRGIALSPPGPPLYPKRWLVEAVGGEFEGVQKNPDETRVMFPLLAGGSIDQIDAVRVIEAFVLAPFEVRVLVDSESPVAPVMDGVLIELVGETRDADTATIEVRIDIDDGSARNVTVFGDGPGWHPATVEGDTVFLTRENEGNVDDSDDPSPFDLVVFGTSWTAVDGEFIVNIAANGE